MAVNYTVIDADGHVLEPFSLWEEYMDPALRERRPRMVIDENGKERLIVEGELLVWRFENRVTNMVDRGTLGGPVGGGSWLVSRSSCDRKRLRRCGAGFARARRRCATVGARRSSC